MKARLLVPEDDDENGVVREARRKWPGKVWAGEEDDRCRNVQIAIYADRNAVIDVFVSPEYFVRVRDHFANWGGTTVGGTTVDVNMFPVTMDGVLEESWGEWFVRGGWLPQV